MSEELITMKRSILDHMIEYMNKDNINDDPTYDPNSFVGYSQVNVDQCEKTLDMFLADLANVAEAARQEQILSVVRKVVLGLNKVNEDCDSRLIETQEREQLCEFITIAAQQAGLVSDEEDITYEWREW